VSSQPDTTTGTDVLPTLDDVLHAVERVAPHIHRTPVFHSRLLSEATGYRVFLKAEMLQRGGSYKIRGPLNKLPQLSQTERDRGVICSSAGNHAQGVALAAAIHGVHAVVVMAENATPAKVAATQAYGAEVIQHGTIWDEANAKALELAAERGLTFVHPFDDPQLICGQGTLGLELVEQCPDLDVVIVPIGGGGLISGVSTSIKGMLPDSHIVGVESSNGPAMKRSIEAGRVVELDEISTVIDGLRVKRVGALTFEIVRRRVDDIVTLPDVEIFDAVLWVMSRTKLLVEGAAAATVGALLGGFLRAEPGSTVVCVLSGGNVNLDDLRGRPWN
jgi:threonine dehydratase